MNKNLKGSLILMLTAFVWGLGFISQSAGMDYIGANTFNGLRMLLGSIILLPIAIVNYKKEPRSKEYKRLFIKSGVICGILLCLGSTIQTLGLAYTTTGKSGFITAMYIIFIPIISVLMKQKITVKTLVCAFIALLGMYLLCLSGGIDSLNFGDLLTLLCALFFALHIIAIDRVSDRVEPIGLSCLQFFVCAVINIILMFTENPSLDIISSCTIPILYSGIIACGIGYTLQPIGQKYADPACASIIMSFESVFALIFGIILLGDTLSKNELLGSIIMFIAIILIQLPDRKARSNK